MLVNDIIKIKYVECGYLKNYPYHMISDKEMIEAFIYSDSNYFDDNYPCVNDELFEEYVQLKDAIKYHLDKYLETEGVVEIPSWVYSYMIGSCVSVNSPQDDRHDMLVALNLDNTYDTITPEVAKSIYAASEECVKRLPEQARSNRPPTMFGEPHVLKHLRLNYQ